MSRLCGAGSNRLRSPHPVEKHLGNKVPGLIRTALCGSTNKGDSTTDGKSEAQNEASENCRIIR